MSAYWANLLVTAGINAIAAWALGFAMRSGQLSVGHAALAGIGGYAAGRLALEGLPVWLTVLIAMIVTGAIGAVLAGLTLRLNHLFLALATLIFGEIAVLVVTSSSELGAASGLVGMPLIDLRFPVAAILALIVVVELTLIRGSRLELQMAIVANDPELVEMSGRSSARLRIGVFAASAMVVAVAGAMHAYQNGVVQPADLNFHRSLDLLVFAVVGGASSGYGPIIGALALTLVPEMLGLNGNDATLFLGAVLVITMLVRTDGVVPRVPVRVTRSGGRPPSAGAGGLPRRARLLRN
ncbi:MAG: branched-chain amino acid ABC transporter permease [Patulibacter sp.]|nr:branched-chain amino acid ABC transporter permease [Patulibacter sp.]